MTTELIFDLAGLWCAFNLLCCIIKGRYTRREIQRMHAEAMEQDEEIMAIARGPYTPANALQQIIDLINKNQELIS